MGIAAENESLDAVLLEGFDDGVLVVRVLNIPVAVFVEPAANSVGKSFGVQVGMYVDHCFAFRLANGFSPARLLIVHFFLINQFRALMHAKFGHN
jgi:hypothetical protein